MTPLVATLSPAVPALTILALGGLFLVFCLVDLVRAERTRHLSKSLWLLVCLLTNPLGGICYLALGRERSRP